VWKLIPFVALALNPIKITDGDQMAGLLNTVSAFNRLHQYVSSPGNRAYCYAELAASSPALPKSPPVLTAPTNRRMVRPSWPGWLV